MKNSAIFFAFNNLASLSPPSPNNPRDESTATMLQSILISDKIKSTALKEGVSVLNTMILVKPSHLLLRKLISKLIMETIGCYKSLLTII